MAEGLKEEVSEGWVKMVSSVILPVYSLGGTYSPFASVILGKFEFEDEKN